jgi:hypothetical protein
MQLQDIMDLENTSSIEIWQDTTSEHIEEYWNSRPFPQIIVWEVSTLLRRQEIVIIPQQRRRLADEETLTPLHNLYYQQNITVSYFQIDGRLAVDDDAIFVEPFKRSQAPYTDSLAINLKMEPGTDIQLIQTIVLEGSNPFPTVAPFNASTGSGGSLSTGTIVLIVIASVIILTGGLGGYLYLRRRQYRTRQGMGDGVSARQVDEEDESPPWMMMMMMLDYPVVVQS